MIEQFAVSQCSLPLLPFGQDLEVLVNARIGGVGICEFKLDTGHDGHSLERFIASGLRATLAVPEVRSILTTPLLSKPQLPNDRIDMLCASVRRLAAFDPLSIGIHTGPLDARNPKDTRQVIVNGLRKVARTAASVHPRGFDISIETAHPKIQTGRWPITSLADAAQLIDDVGEPNLKIVLDSGSVAGDADYPERLGQYVNLIGIVRVIDPRLEYDLSHGLSVDRGRAVDFSVLGRALKDLNYRGWYELEVSGAMESSARESISPEWTTALLRRAQARFRNIHREIFGVP